MILRNEVIGFAGFGELSFLAIRRRFPRIWAAYDSDRMVASGHSLPIHSAPVPNNVRYASDSGQMRGSLESKCGDEMMRVMLYEAAQSMLRSTKWSWLKAWAMKIARHRGIKKAIVCHAEVRTARLGG